jgi:hypothetical protein
MHEALADCNAYVRCPLHMLGVRSLEKQLPKIFLDLSVLHNFAK